jgi:hypothetical protein
MGWRSDTDPPLKMETDADVSTSVRPHDPACEARVRERPGHRVVRHGATLKNGTRTNYWVRWTTCPGKITGRWLIPADVASGRALLDLVP